MRQVTGSNYNTTLNSMSIRLLSGGHSFLWSQLEQIPTDKHLSVEILTYKTTLVPKELLKSSNASNLLGLCGLGCSSNEQCITCQSNDDYTAIMAVQQDVIEALNARFSNAGYHITTPLLHTSSALSLHPSLLWIHFSDTHLYIKVYTKSTLQHAEVCRVDSPDDLLRIVGIITDSFDLSLYKLIIEGSNSDQAKRVLRPYFKNQICE